MGLGRLAVSARRLCHCCGRPVNFCSRGSKPVWTRCSKLDGAEISSRFFFFPNMLENPGKPGNPKRKKKHTCINILAAALATLMFDARELKTVSLRCRYEVIMAVYSPSCLKFNLLFYIVLGRFIPPLCSMMNLLSYNAAGYRRGKNKQNYPNTQNKRKKAKCPL